ncbi:hypothetical protein BDY24DRAFT_257169 [Mrakia frigida]|uniref:uncharacterized protein n=1 Tax=Mrakia frigida TaxID=29902 RepID=UPI003FCC1F17
MQKRNRTKLDSSSGSARPLLPSIAPRTTGALDAHALADKLKLTLSYCRLKIDHGWAENSLSEVEALFERGRNTRPDQLVFHPGPLLLPAPSEPLPKSKPKVRERKKIKLAVLDSPCTSPSCSKESEEGSSLQPSAAVVASSPPPPLFTSAPPAPSRTPTLLPPQSPSFTLIVHPKGRGPRRPSSVAESSSEGLVDAPPASWITSSVVLSGNGHQHSHNLAGQRRGSEPVPFEKTPSSFVASFRGPKQEMPAASHPKPSRSASIALPPVPRFLDHVATRPSAEFHASSSSHAHRVAPNSPHFLSHGTPLSTPPTSFPSPSTPLRNAPQLHHPRHCLPIQQPSSSSLPIAQPQPQPQLYRQSRPNSLSLPSRASFDRPRPSYPPPSASHSDVNSHSNSKPSRKRSSSHQGHDVVEAQSFFDPFERDEPLFLYPSFHTDSNGGREGLVDFRAGGGGWEGTGEGSRGMDDDDDDASGSQDFASVLLILEEDLERAAAGREEREMGVGVQDGWAVIEGNAEGGLL